MNLDNSLRWKVYNSRTHGGTRPPRTRKAEGKTAGNTAIVPAPVSEIKFHVPKKKPASPGGFPTETAAVHIRTTHTSKHVVSWYRLTITLFAPCPNARADAPALQPHTGRKETWGIDCTRKGAHKNWLLLDTKPLFFFPEQHKKNGRVFLAAPARAQRKAAAAGRPSSGDRRTRWRRQKES